MFVIFTSFAELRAYYFLKALRRFNNSMLKPANITLHSIIYIFNKILLIGADYLSLNRHLMATKVYSIQYLSLIKFKGFVLPF